MKEKVKKFQNLAPELPLTEHHLVGSAEHLPLEILERKTEELLKDMESRRTAQELKQLQALPEEAKSSGWENTMTAAREGRVEKLMLANDSQSKPQQNQIAAEVLQHGGTLTVVPEKRSLEDEVVGILRW